MKKNSKTLWFVVRALVALIVPVMTLSAQSGGRGGAAVPRNNPPPTSPATGDPVNGKALYYAYSCYACHGYNGETGARPFVGNWGNLQTEQSFLLFLRARANLAPTNKSTYMPNFAESTLPDEKAKDIYAYIRTFKSNAPELKDIPTLNAIVEAAEKPAKK